MAKNSGHREKNNSDWRVESLICSNRSPEPRYKITEVKDTGGTADIFTADDLHHPGRTFILKRFRDKAHWEHYLNRERDGLIYMEKHCALSAIRVYDTDCEQRFVALEFGESDLWKEGIKDKPLKLMKTYELSCILTRKIADAHKVIMIVDGRERNIIHRDIKLSNVFFLKKGEAESMRLGDFGSSKIVDDKFVDSNKDGSTRYLRPKTCEYTAPEDLKNEAEGTEPTLDIFSLGMVLYFLLEGKNVIPKEEP